MTATADSLPADVAKRLDAFCSEGKAGRFVLDIKDGRVMGWEIVEKGTVRRGI